ncbi:MAG: hypothetical protein DMD73_04110 [Gemmatimonadetes bacterium]|nr:MAG: hypothetical protein DMD73_04110 [Gemmatimonadota bacterium]
MNDDGTLDDAGLRQVARRLGARAADRVDVERTAQAVVARLREERHEPSSREAWLWTSPVWLKIAAALVIVAGAGVVARAVRHAPSGLAAPVETVDLGDLSVAELRELLQSVEQPGAAEPVSWLDVGLEDLSPAELRTLLASLEPET